MSGRLFNRGARLTLAKPTATTIRGGRFGAFFGVQPNGIEIGGADASSGLRFTFTIEKTLEAEPNNAEIVVYNLSETTRAEFQTKPVNVRLDVGYDGDLQRLFVGDLRWCEHRMDGVNVETRLQVADGERAYRHARVNRSFRGDSATARNGITEAARAMGLDLPPGFDLPGLGNVFSGGLSMTGPAQREMTRLLDPYDAQWSIQDGRLQILRSADTRSEPAVLVSQETGLVGSPEYGPSKNPKKPPLLKLKMLLYPGLTPGGLIQVASKSIRGVFKVVRIMHTGDTHGSDWYSEIEAKAR